jgi:hypothetical protein
MSLSPSRCSWSLLLFAASCGAAAPQVIPSSASQESAGNRRAPDGVAIDPVSAPPVARDRADASQGLVTLRAPLGIEVATEAVMELFRRVVREDREAIPALFTSDALVTTPSTQHAPTSRAVDSWSMRFNKLDYTKLAGEPVVREAELEIFRPDDLRQALGSAPIMIRADALADADVVVRVPIATPRVGQDRLLGDEMVIWLRREGDKYKIYRIHEDFQLQ